MSNISITEDDHHGLNKVITRAATDVAFRQQLLSDPHAAIEAATGTKLSSAFRIRFVEKDPELDALVVLPDIVDEQAELTEEELEAVAGGAEEAFICWGTCDETCDKTCILTSLSPF